MRKCSCCWPANTWRRFGLDEKELGTGTVLTCSPSIYLYTLPFLDGNDSMLVGYVNNRRPSGNSSSVSTVCGDVSWYLRVFSHIRLRQLVPKCISLYHENRTISERGAIKVFFNTSSNANIMWMKMFPQKRIISTDGLNLPRNEVNCYITVR